MNTKLLVVAVTFIVISIYLSIFYIIQHWKDMRQPRRIPEPPNFKTKVIRYTDGQGNEVERYTEFNVTTKMVDDETLKKLPPPPDLSKEPIPVESGTPKGAPASPSSAPAANPAVPTEPPQPQSAPAPETGKTPQ